MRSHYVDDRTVTLPAGLWTSSSAEGGVAFGGTWMRNDALIEAALNDLRNKAASLWRSLPQKMRPSWA
jgi:hypothetical protein